MAVKEVQIRRRETKSHLPPPVVANAKKVLSSIYSGQGPLKGISGELEKELLSEYLGIDREDDNFPRICRHFWADLRVEIPSDGKVLNISTKEEEIKGKDGKVIAEEKPVNIHDWLVYKWSQKHKYVADDRQSMLDDSTKQFYIYDPEVETKHQNIEVKFKQKAYKEFIKISDDEDKINRLLTVLDNAEPENMSLEQKQNLIDQIIEDNPQRFFQVATDKDLEIKSYIAQMVAENILNKIGNQYYFIDEKLGNTLEEAVLYFKDKKNSETINILKAKLQEAKKK